MSKKGGKREVHTRNIRPKKTKRIRPQKPLEKSEATLRALLEFASDGIVVIESSGEISLVNARAEEMFGYTRDQLLGQSLEILLPERLRGVHTAHRGSYSAQPRSRPMGLGLDLVGRRQDGTEFPVEISLSYIETGEGPLVMAFVIDITERKRSESQLKALLQEKEILLKEINHRVKNNLQAITNLLYIQQSTIRDERVREIFRETQNRIKSIALVHEKLYPTEHRLQVDLSDYLESLARQLVASYQADPASIALQIKVDPVPLAVETVVSLGIIVNELISNALKHAFPGGRGGEITVELTQITGGRLLLAVSDNGIGLPEAGKTGSGSMGLQLVSMLAGYMQGTVAFTSAGGTRVSVEFMPWPAAGG